MVAATLSAQTDERKSRVSRLLGWSLVAFVCLLAVLAWGSTYQWSLLPLSIYTVFPLLGLLAFSIMWSHYMVGALQRYWKLDKKVLATFFRSTGYVVLVLICLHPGLLIYQRFHEGYGLPPGSYESYVAPGLGWVTILGTASLFVFLAFELHRFFAQYSWWRFVAGASDAAMLAIVYHGLRLGSQLQQGWYHWVWLFYFGTLLAALSYKYAKLFKRTGLKAT